MTCSPPGFAVTARSTTCRTGPQGCRACVPLRVPVATFEPTKSQRRALRRGDEAFTIDEGPPLLEREHVDLFNRHARHVSDRADGIGVREYVEFLLESSVETVQFVYRHRGELAGIGILDLGERSASSIYFFWEPELAALSTGHLLGSPRAPLVPRTRPRPLLPRLLDRGLPRHGLQGALRTQ